MPLLCRTPAVDVLQVSLRHHSFTLQLSQIVGQARKLQRHRTRVPWRIANSLGCVPIMSAAGSGQHKRSLSQRLGNGEILVVGGH